MWVCVGAVRNPACRDCVEGAVRAGGPIAGQLRRAGHRESVDGDRVSPADGRQHRATEPKFARLGGGEQPVQATGLDAEPGKSWVAALLAGVGEAGVARLTSPGEA